MQTVLTVAQCWTIVYWLRDRERTLRRDDLARDVGVKAVEKADRGNPKHIAARSPVP